MRQELDHRPSLVACFGLIIGLASSIQPWLVFLLIPGSLLLLRLSMRLCMVASCAAGLSLGLLPSSAPIIASRIFEGRVTVVGVPQVYEGVFAADVSHDTGVYRMTWPGPELSLWDEVDIKGELRPLREGAERQGGLQGILGRLRIEDGNVRKVADGPAVWQIGSDWRRSFISFADSTLEPRRSRALQAFTFNIDTGLDDDFRQQLQRSGTIHIISASGLHVLILAVALHGLFGLLPIPRPALIALIVFVLMIYAAAAGFRPPIVRSVVMATLMMGAYIWRREADLLSALGVAMLGYLIFKPNSIHDIGFQLSFLTVGALAMFLRFEPPAEQGLVAVIKRQMLDLAKASFVASMASAPLVAYHFGQFSIISVLANLAIAPLIAPILVCGLIGLAISPIAFVVSAGLMRIVVGPLLDALQVIVEFFGSLPFAAIEVPEFSAYWLLPIYGSMLLAWRKHVRPA